MFDKLLSRGNGAGDVAAGRDHETGVCRVVYLVPADCPLVIESIIPAELIEHELDAVSALFGGVVTQAAIA